VNPPIEVVAEVERWRRAGRRVAIARVVATEGSSPREPGATMAVSEDGEVAGSVSGGCVEGAVVTEALALLSRGDPPATSARRISFGYSDDEAFSVGLTCGGTIHLLIEELDAGGAGVGAGFSGIWRELCQILEEETPAVLCTVVALKGDGASLLLGARLLVAPGEKISGTLGNDNLDRVVARDALGVLDLGVAGLRHYGPQGQARQDEVTVLHEAFSRPPRLVIFGAVDFTAALARVAKTLGFQVTVCDARPIFATKARFPMADEVVVDRPERYLDKIGEELGPRDAVCVLTHDPKFDVPAVQAALATRVGYLGAMGSRRTHDDRRARLLDAGVEPGELDERLMSPIGLDLGARTPEETAIAICAEIVARRHGRPVPSLRDHSGAIH